MRACYCWLCRHRSYFSCSCQAQVIWGCKKTQPTKTSAILDWNHGYVWACVTAVSSYLVLALKSPKGTGNEFQKAYIIFRLHSSARERLLSILPSDFFQFKEALNPDVGEISECSDCGIPWRKAKRGEKVKAMLCVSRNEESARCLYCRTWWGKLRGTYRST